ncbi:MAG: hydroxyacid dehydrogenase [Alphaproteobacteria bacterium]|nr:hydroxyacid dehydrogenase [Alphaproteobacteria bacterium]
MSPNKKKVLLPNTMAKAGWDVLIGRDDIEAVGYEPYLSMPDLQTALKDTDGIALSLTPLKAPEIAAAPRLRVAARIGVGFDAVEVPALTARGIPLMVVGTANSVSVAEHAIFMMYSLAKQVMAQDKLVRANRWKDRWSAMPVDLAEKTLLIVGFGRIGTRTAKRCLAMDMPVMVYDPYVPAATIKAAGCEPVSDLDAALPRADVVTIHCPKTPETLGMFNAARFARMKPTAFIINTARGGIIDEPALKAALASGKLAGAGIDVFDKEPPAADNPLYGQPNTIVSAHMAGVTAESVERMAVTTVKNILSVLDGTPNKENAVNKEVFG